MRLTAKLTAFTFSVLAITIVSFSGSALASQHEQQQQEEHQETEKVMIVVQPGDNLSKIAKAHESTWVRIFNANETIKHPDIIHPNDELRIPADDEELEARALPTPPQPTPAPAPRQVTNSSRPAAVPASQPQPVVSTAPAVASGSVWDRLAQCESSGNWQINTGNGYYGGLQFLPSTWRGVGGTGLPHQHSREEQIKRAEILLARAGWGQWPACSKKLGLR